MDAYMVIPHKSSFGPLHVPVNVFIFGDRVRASLHMKNEMTMFSGSLSLWLELIKRGLVIDV